VPRCCHPFAPVEEETRVANDRPHYKGKCPDPHDDGHYDPRHPISHSQPCPDNNERDNNDCEGSETKTLAHFHVPNANPPDSGRQQPQNSECKQETRGLENIRTDSQVPTLSAPNRAVCICQLSSLQHHPANI
jgi:hypothetical protein